MNYIEESYIKNDNEIDSSFKSDSKFDFIFPKRYKLSDLRDAWTKGKEVGFEIGLYYNSHQGQELQLSNNIQNPNDKEFYDNFLRLCIKHNIRISYHPLKGMIFEKLNN